MSLVYKGLSVSCFNRQLQPKVTQHGPPGRAPPTPKCLVSSRPRQMLRVTGKVVVGVEGEKEEEEASCLPAASEMFQELRESHPLGETAAA